MEPSNNKTKLKCISPPSNLSLFQTQKGSILKNNKQENSLHLECFVQCLQSAEVNLTLLFSKTTPTQFLETSSRFINTQNF